jgi:hypothetical protein
MIGLYKGVAPKPAGKKIGQCGEIMNPTGDTKIIQFLVAKYFLPGWIRQGVFTNFPPSGNNSNSTRRDSRNSAFVVHNSEDQETKRWLLEKVALSALSTY